MKKETILKQWSSARGKEIDAIKNLVLQEALSKALNQCIAWTELPWISMATPVAEKLKAIETEAAPLFEKYEHNQLSAEDRSALDQLDAVHELYHQFYSAIFPTVRRAKQEQRRQERYRTNAAHPPASAVTP